MPEEKDFDYVVGKLPRRDKDGNDTTGDRIGKGGRHRDDGTYSAVAYDLEVVDEDPTKKAPEPTVIVQREVVEVEKQPTRYEDLPWYGQLICDGIEMVMPYVVDGLVNLTERGINTGISAVKRKAAAKREKCVQQKKEVTAHIEPSESAQMATTPEKATTVLDEIDAAYENYSINMTSEEAQKEFVDAFNALLRDRLSTRGAELLAAETEKDRVAAEVDELIESVDEDIQKLKKQVEELTRANEILTYENQGLRSKMSSADNMPILYLGEEEEFYQGEIKEMILDAIAEKLKNLGEKTRRWDVLTDVLNANDYQKIRDERERTVKILFKDYKTLSASMRQQLLGNL